MAWTYQSLPADVTFGWDAIARLATPVVDRDLRRVVVLSTGGHRGLAEKSANLIGSRCAGGYSGARMHVPTEVVEAALVEVQRLDADGFVAVGGGSTTGLGKALARRTGLPLIAVPTTYSGSEATPLWGETSRGVKRTGRDLRALPSAVVYDPALTLTLPFDLTLTSVVNAMAHAVEATYAPDRSPITTLLAGEAVALAVRSLAAVEADAADREGRESLLQAAWLAGWCLGATTMGLHHKLCHTLGGALDLPHAATHTVVLPHVMRFNLGPGSPGTDVIALALGDGDPATTLWELTASLGGPTSLHQLGMREQDVAAVVDTVLSSTFANPRPVDRESLVRLVGNAFVGDKP